jgi:peptidyl-prolyl cis-trans isomerase A (cyclophilin A)
MIRILALLLVLASVSPSWSQGLGNPAALTEQAPATYRVLFDTTKGPFVIEVHRDWAPNGADRFYNLVKNGFYDDVRFFRVLENFMVQFGINGDPRVSAAWRQARIKDDPVRISNKRTFVTFATAGPNTRTTQVFINYGDNHNLDSQGFTPFGQVVSGMNVADALYSGYGESAPHGLGPDQEKMQTEGNPYVAKFTKLDYIKKATIQ